MGWDPAQAPAGLPHTYTHIPARTSQSSQRVQATPAPPAEMWGEALKIQGLKVEVTCQILPTCQDPQLPG